MNTDAEGELIVDRGRRAAGRRLLAGLVRTQAGRVTGAALAVVVSTAALLAMPLLVKRGIDVAVRQGAVAPLLVALGLFLLAATVDYAASGVALRLVGRVAEDSLRDLRGRLFAHVMAQPLAFFERVRSGRVVARMTSDLEALQELLGQAAVAVVSNLLLLSGIAVAMVLLDPVLAAAVLAVVPLLLAATVAFGRRSRSAYQRVRERVGAVLSAVGELLTGVRVVQAFAREQRTAQEFRQVNHAYRDANAETVVLLSIYGPGVELLGQIAVVVVLVVGGGRALALPDPALYVGTLTAFVLFLRQFFDPLQELVQFFNSWQSATAAATQIAGVLDTSASVPEAAEPRPLPPGQGEIRLSGVSFAYPGARSPVLRNIDLLVPAGSTLALVGSTGAGKSSLAKLIARFYDPTEGSVRLDGVDLRELSRGDLRGAVAVITQEPFLFSGTVADNIRFGRPGALDGEVAAAASTVGLHDVVTALPLGYDTDVSRRGARLSAGQRQLIAFARVWLADPRVLVLDEATSALDLPSERLVQRALSVLLEGRTAVVIAHRFSSIDNADRVAVVEDGRVVEQGERAALLAADGVFAGLYGEWMTSLGLAGRQRPPTAAAAAYRPESGQESVGNRRR